MNIEEYNNYLKTIAQNAQAQKKVIVKTTKTAVTKQKKLQPKTFNRKQR